VVYCLEEADNPEGFDTLTLAEGAELRIRRDADKLGGIVEVSARMNGGTLTFIPYYAWDNREPGKMKVWVPWLE
jgi:hypothetical protein